MTHTALELQLKRVLVVAGRANVESTGVAELTDVVLASVFIADSRDASGAGCTGGRVMDVNEPLSLDHGICVNARNGAGHTETRFASLMTLYAGCFFRVDINDRTGRESHGGECADGVIVAGIATDHTGLGGIVDHAGFGSIRPKEINKTGTAVALRTTSRYNGGIVLVPVDECFGIGIGMRAACPGFLRCVCERYEGPKTQDRRKQ